MKNLFVALLSTISICLACFYFPANATAYPSSQFPDYDINNLELHVPADHPLGGPGILVKCTTEQSKLKILVTKVFPVGPAQEAKIKAGDIITSINGITLSNMQPKDAINKLRGNAGQTLTQSTRHWTANW